MAPVGPLPPIAIIYTIAVERGEARCQPWSYDATSHEYSWSTTTQKQRLTLTSTLVFTDERTLPDGTSVAMSCGSTDVRIRNTPEAVSVDGASLFLTETSCKRALSRHENVAFVPDCTPNDATAEQSATTQARFVKVLAQGGTMYAHITEDDGAERCEKYRFRSAPLAVKLPEVSGTAIYSEIRDMQTVKHVEAFRFMPGSSHPRLFLDDRDRSLQFGDDVVTGIAPMFFTARECRAAIDENLATRSWQPD